MKGLECYTPFIVGYFLVFLLLLPYFISMTSTNPLVPEYIYVVIRIKLDVTYSKVSHDVMVCHYGDTNDVFLIGGLVLQNETLVALLYGTCVI